MASRPYKHKKKGTGRHVQLLEWFQKTEAWGTLKPGPRALYIELKRRFNGSNNGGIFLSHRDGAEALNVSRETVGKYYSDLEKRGFLLKTQGHCLGPSGVGQSDKWCLTEEPLNGSLATMDFKRWKEPNPGRKNRHSLAGKSGTPY